MSDPVGPRFTPPPPPPPAPRKAEGPRADARKPADKARGAKGPQQKQAPGGKEARVETEQGDSFSRGVGGTQGVATTRAAGPRATIRCAPSAAPRCEGDIRAAGQLAIEYHPDRARLRSPPSAAPAWGVTAIVAFLPGGSPVEREVVQFGMFAGRPTGPRPSIITLEVPVDATGVALHFRNWTRAPAPQEVLDDDHGAPFRFPVKPRLPP